MTALPIDYLSVIEVNGEESGAFLQSQLSADIEALSTGDCNFACYCTPRGQVIALLLVCRLEDSWRLVVASELAEAVLQRLRLYVMRAKATFTLLESEAVLGSNDPASGFRPGELPLAYRFGELQGANSNDQWKAAELAAGVFWLQAETSEQFIPQMLGYDDIGAVSFSKGCYPGQEIVARARYLGKVKRGVRRVLLETSLSLPVMEKVRIERDEEWASARVMDSVETAQGGTLAIVHCTREPESAITALEMADKRYFCATI